MNKYLEKIARKVVEDVKEHQDRSVNKLLENKGVLLHHSTGSGKTRTILEAVHRIQKKDKGGKHLIITPASLTTNIEKEHKKHGLPIDMKNVEVISYEKATNDIERLKKNKYSLIALDEAQKLRNTDTKRFKELAGLVSSADHRLLASATPHYNGAHNIAPLLNIAAGKKIMPTEKKEFEERYVSRTMTKPGLVAQFLRGEKPEEKISIKNKKELKGILKTYVDHYDVKTDPEAQKHFPKETHETHEIPMDANQERMYNYLENKIPWAIKMKIRHNMPLDKKESAALNSFSTGVRQVSNSTRPYVSGGAPVTPKIQKATDELHKHLKSDKNFRGVVYSNYLQAGLHDYSEVLRARKVKHHVYHGGLSKAEKSQIVNDYNEGKVPVLLISSSGAEGLDLKGTKLTQVLEPHFNASKINQVKGRGGRYKSHAHLPPEERKMKVQHFISTFSPGYFGANKSKTIDQYLKENSINKDSVSEEMNKLLKED